MGVKKTEKKGWKRPNMAWTWPFCFSHWPPEGAGECELWVNGVSVFFSTRLLIFNEVFLPVGWSFDDIFRLFCCGHLRSLASGEPHSDQLECNNSAGSSLVVLCSAFWHLNKSLCGRSTLTHTQKIKKSNNKNIKIFAVFETLERQV